MHEVVAPAAFTVEQVLLGVEQLDHAAQRTVQVGDVPLRHVADLRRERPDRAAYTPPVALEHHRAATDPDERPDGEAGERVQQATDRPGDRAGEPHQDEGGRGHRSANR